MVTVPRSWRLGLAFLGAYFFGSSGVAQQPPSPDPWQFPFLVASKPFQRWHWALEQRAYPLPDIPKEAKASALLQIEQFKASLSPDARAIQGGMWVNLGPAPVLGGQIGSTGNTRPMSGRVADIAVDPGNPDRWLIGAAQGGIWETTDTGATWTAKTDDQASLAMGAIAFAPSDGTIIYGGTGEAAFSGDAYAGAGLVKSTDGGTTWVPLAMSAFAKSTFSDIKVHPTTPDVVVVTTTYGAAGRGGGSQQAARGVYKSINGGTTWVQRLPGDATDLEVHPDSFNSQYAGLGNIFTSPLNGVFRSIDGGDSWTRIDGPWSSMAAGIGRVEMAIAPSNPDVLYVSIQDGINGVGADAGLLGLWRTDNAFADTPTWVQVPTGATDDGTGTFGYCGWDFAYMFPARQCWYDHEIIVDPANANTLFAGGVPLWKCTDCGFAPTWEEISKTVSDPQNGIHADQHTMAWAGERLVVGNDGGVWSTTDGGGTWAEHNTALSTIQFYDGSIHPNSPLAIGGSQDNGTEKTAGAIDWEWIFGGDGADSAIAAANPDTHWVVSFQQLGIVRTIDSGMSFTSAIAGIERTGVPFIARFEKCPAVDDVLIAGTDNLWKSTDFFIGTPPFWLSNGPEMGSGITGLAFAESDLTCQTYAFGTANGQLRLTADGGVTWNDIDVANAVPNRYVTDLAFDPATASTMYVTLSGFDEGTPSQPGHLFTTSNALDPVPTWSNVSPPVNIPFNTVALDPLVPSTIYLGTDLAVWKSTDDGTTWTHMGPATGMPNVAVFELQISPGMGPVAFTHGRGAFALLPPIELSRANTATRGPIGTGRNQVRRAAGTVRQSVNASGSSR